MNMKWWHSKKAYLLEFVILISYFSCLSAQNGYEKRIEKYQTFWNHLIPSYTKIQYAGNMGLLSFGTGWDYGKNNQWETDVFFGFVPKYDTDKFKVTFTVKQNFIPWKIKLKKGFSIDPLACGLYVNTVFGEDFWSKEPAKYPDNYYKFSTKIRFNIYLGQRITFRIPPEKRFFAKSITLFYEVSTNELYLISAVQNSYLKPDDYLSLSLGLKMQVF